MIYTIKSRCVEMPDMPYDDGATTIFLYTKGHEGIPSSDVKEFLEYFEDTIPENAVNLDLLRIDNLVKKIKRKAKVSVRYMRMMEDEYYLIQQGIELERENTKKAEERAISAEKKLVEKDAEIAEVKAQLSAKINNPFNRYNH